MRILFLSHTLGDAYGQERIMRDSSSLLRREGHQVFFGTDQITGPLPAHDGYFSIPGLAQLGTLTPSRAVKTFQTTLLQQVKTAAPDIIHWVDLFDHRIMNLLSQTYPSVLTAHTVAPTCPSSQRFFPTGGVCHKQSGWDCLLVHQKQQCLSHFKSILHRSHALLEFQLKKRALKKFSALVAISRYVETCLLNDGWAPEQVKLIYNPVTAFSSNVLPIASPPKNLLVVASRLVALKGIGPLLINLSQLKDEEWTLWIFGDGPLRNELEALSQKLGLFKRVVFHGKQNPEVVQQALLSSRVFLQANRGPEGFGMAVAEASALGVPVIAHEVPALNELIESETNGLLVPLESELGFKDAIQRILRDDALWKHLSQNGPRLMKERFSAEHHLRRTLEVYQRCLSTFDPNRRRQPASLAMDY